MTLTKISESEAELHQPPTPTFHLESWTRFKLVAPHYIDLTFRCKPHQHVFAHGYIGLFWASYIDAPENKAIYFRDDKGWVQFCTQTHNDESTVLHVGDKPSSSSRRTPGQCFTRVCRPHASQIRSITASRVRTRYILMFDRTDGIRFSHSPSGGGPPSATETAWDWQFIIPDYEVAQEYGYRARMTYRDVVPGTKSWRSIRIGARR